MIRYMGMEEVGAYLRMVRRERGYTQESLAEAVDTSKRTIERLERAEGDITAPTFLRVVAVLRASGDQLTYLATHPLATIREAEALAQAWLQGNVLPFGDDLVEAAVAPDLPVARILALMQSMEPDQLVDVLQELSRLMYAQRMHLRSGPRPKSWSGDADTKRSPAHGSGAHHDAE